MKTSILSLFAFFLLSGSISAQNPIIWKKTYGDVYKRKIRDVIITDTTYYILCEKTQNNADVELINTNKLNGKLNFSEIYSGQGVDSPHDMYKINSSILIYGNTNSQEGIFDNNHGSGDGFSIKTDLFGNFIDTNFWGGSLGDDVITSKISSNKYISVGSSNSINGDLSSCPGTGTYRQWAFTFDTIGNILQSHCNDTIIQHRGLFFFQNGHYYLCTSGIFMNSGGYTYDYPPNSQGNPGSPSKDFLVVEYDTMLNVINVKNFGSDSQEGLYKSIRTNDNGFMLFGFTDYIHDTLEVSGGIGGRDLYCIKLDSNANFQWSKCLGSLGSDEPMDICQTADHGYLVLGEIQQASGDVSHFFGQRDIWLAKIDSVGNLLWERTYGGSYNDRPSLVREDSDGTIIIVGTTNSTDGTFSGMSIQGQDDMFVIKLAPWVGINSSEKTNFSVRIYPNPTQSGSTINLKGLPIKNSQYQLSIYNIQGQQLNSQQFNASYTKQVQLPQLSNGVYFIRLINEEGVVRTAKFIIN